MKKIYAAIILIPLFGGISARLLRITLAFLLRGYGLSVFEITLLSSSFMLARGIFSPIFGKIADRNYIRLQLILVGFSGLALDSFLYMLVPYPVMLLLRALDGIFGAMIWPSMQAFVHFSAGKDKKARLMSIYFIMGSVGMAAGYIFYNLILGELYYAVMTVVIFQISSIFFALFFRGFERERRKYASKTGDADKVPFFMYSLTFLFGMFIGLGNEVLMFYLAEVMKLGKYATTTFLFIAGLYTLLGSYTTSLYADKISMDNAIIITAIFGMVGSVLISINNLFLAILGTLLFYISARAFMPLSRTYVSSRTKNIGAALGYINMSSNLGAVISPLIGGIVMDFFEYGKAGIVNLAAITFVIFGFAITINAFLLKFRE